MLLLSSQTFYRKNNLSAVPRATYLSLQLNCYNQHVSVVLFFSAKPSAEADSLKLCKCICTPNALQLLIHLN